VKGAAFGWWAWATVALAGVFLPPLQWQAMGWIRPLMPRSQGAILDPAQSALAGGASLALLGLVSALAVGLALRSWQLGAFFAIIGLAGAYIWLEVSRSSFGLEPTLIALPADGVLSVAAAWSWSGFAFVVLLAWAIRGRLAWRPRGSCHACGYDLAGNSNGVCPECGPQTGHEEVSTSPAP
jgi:hypothetical protein